MAQEFFFDGDFSRIRCQNTSSFTMDEIYSRWKDWVLTSDNAKYLQAFRFVGGDPTVGGKSLGVTYFLMNNWRIVPYTGSSDYDLNVQGNLFLDEATNAASASNPYEFPGVLVRQEVSNLTDAQVLESEISQRLEYGGKVYIDTVSGTSGSSYPIGTSAQPSNNWVQAIQIANTNGFHEIATFDSLVLGADAPNITVTGISNGLYMTLDGDTYDYTNMEFNNVILTGTGSDNMHIKNCILYNLENVIGLAGSCGLSGSIHIKDGANVVLHDCFSTVPGLGSPVIDLSGSDNVSLSIRGYSGGLRIASSSGASNIITLEYLAGRCNMDVTNTNGFASIRGVAYLNDEGSTMLMDTASLLDPARLHSKLDIGAAKVGDIHQVHGLDATAPLYVSKTQRLAGAVTQSFVTGSDDVTVTRL